jgi:hypothetical protein
MSDFWPLCDLARISREEVSPLDAPARPAGADPAAEADRIAARPSHDEVIEP